MDCSTPGFPVLHYLLEFAQTRIQWCHPTVLPSVVPFSSCSPSFQCLLDIRIRVFSSESALHIRWPKYTPEVKCSNTNEVKITQSCLTLCYPMDCSPWHSPGQNTGVGCCPLLQRIFPTQGLNPGLLLCRQILYQLNHIWCEEPTHWKRPWSWERLRVGGEGDDRGWDGWMASLTQWTWVWTNSRRYWRTQKPGILQSMGFTESALTQQLNNKRKE